MLEVGRFIFVSSNINKEIKKLNKNQNKRLKKCKKKTMVKEILHVIFFSVSGKQNVLGLLAADNQKFAATIILSIKTQSYSASL